VTKPPQSSAVKSAAFEYYLNEGIGRKGSRALILMDSG
jgi:hypothetical protein